FFALCILKGRICHFLKASHPSFKPFASCVFASGLLVWCPDWFAQLRGGAVKCVCLCVSVCVCVCLWLCVGGVLFGLVCVCWCVYLCGCLWGGGVSVKLCLTLRESLR